MACWYYKKPYEHEFENSSAAIMQLQCSTTSVWKGVLKTFFYLNTTEPVKRDVCPSHHFDSDVESVEDEKNSDLFKGKKNPE